MPTVTPIPPEGADVLVSVVGVPGDPAVANEAIVALLDAGTAPFLGGNVTEVSAAWTRVADVLLWLPGGKVDGPELQAARKAGVPVYYTTRGLVGELELFRTGHAGYLKLLTDMVRAHRSRAALAADGDPFFTLRACREIGMEPWRAAMVRLKGAAKRLDLFCAKGRSETGGAADLLLRLADYALTALALRNEEPVLKT